MRLCTEIGLWATFSKPHAYFKHRQIFNMRRIHLLTILLAAQQLCAQPYVDLAAVKYQYSPDAGIFRRNYHPNHFTYGAVGLNIPIVFKDSSVLLLAPSAEQWQIRSEALPDIPPVFKGLALPLTFVKPLNTIWTATVVFVPRWNGAATFHFNNNMQAGGAVLLTYKKRADLKYKFGLYYNREFFGNFFIPLIGIDWKINNRLQLFGVLPGNVVLERKVSRHFYYGATFRAITTSYRYGDLKNFLRIDDNQLQAFADWYLTKTIVLNAEAGHSVLRRFRTGITNGDPKYEVDDKFNDNVLLRVALLYRMRFQ